VRRSVNPTPNPDPNPTQAPITKLFAGGGGGWRGEDMCYERLRAEASVN
jgi:hypothetical protein